MQPLNVGLFQAAKSDENTLRNLLQLYIHDFSEFLGMRPSEEGWFSYPSLPLYWSEPTRVAYLIRAEGSLVGFALVSRGSVVSGDPAVLDLAEFFVIRGVRRRGVGAAAARQLFRSFPGRWEVRVGDFNAPAQKFWKNAIERYVRERFQIEPWTRDDGSPWKVFRFESSGAMGGGADGT